MYVPELRMVILRPIGHIAAWLVWHSTGKSLLSDLESPEPPTLEARRLFVNDNRYIAP